MMNCVFEKKTLQLQVGAVLRECKLFYLKLQVAAFNFSKKFYTKPEV